MSRATLARAALAALAALAATAVAPAPARAFVPIGTGRWDARTLPISYRTNGGSVPTYLDRTMALAAIDAGFAAWTLPACTGWRVRNAGDTTTTRDLRDGVNSVYFQSSGWPSDLGDVSVTLGVTMQIYTGSRGSTFTSDADMVLNNVGFRWSLDGSRGNPDLQSIVTHESGHFLGLDHPPIPAAIMYASYSGGIKRTLTADDTTGVCTLYPTSVTPGDAGATPVDAGTPADPCASNAACGSCTAAAACGWCGATARCVTGMSTGPVSGTCGSGWAWRTTECSATPMDAGTPRPDSGTPRVDVVVPPIDTGVTADPCNANAACGTCTPVAGCGWCGASSRCVSGTTAGPSAGACGTGWAWQPAECPVTPGTGATGTSCTQPGDCAGAYCVATSATATSGICTQVCTDDCGCPDGFRCVDTSTAGLRVCGPGARMCGAPVPDASAPRPDVVVAPPDVSIPPPDVSIPPPDVSIPPVRDAGRADTGVPNVTPDAGVSDSGAPSRDVDAGERDSGASSSVRDSGMVVFSDAGNSTRPDARVVPDGGSGAEPNPGCACSTPGRPARSGPWAPLGVAAALIAVATRRRRRA